MTDAGTQRPSSPGVGLPPIVVPVGFNYIGAFLTFDCNLNCSYCLNRFGALQPARMMLTGEEWVDGLNRIVPRPDLPVTLQGGEPTLHPDFYVIISELRRDLPLDILTNLELDSARFMREVSPARVSRDAPYASIRVSFHPETMKIEDLAGRVLAFLKAGYSIGIWAIDHPMYRTENVRALEYCTSRGIDFRTKDFLGEHGGRLHGRYRYPGGCDKQSGRRVECRTTELLIGPGGDIFRCHGDLYEGREPVGHLLDPAFAIDPGFRPCNNFGQCNPCDIKMKTNRLQQPGHTSVEVRFSCG